MEQKLSAQPSTSFRLQTNEMREERKRAINNYNEEEDDFEEVVQEPTRHSIKSDNNPTVSQSFSERPVLSKVQIQKACILIDQLHPMRKLRIT
jgi:hypothetical protein